MKIRFSTKNVILIITYILIFAGGIYYKTPIYRLLPLFISVVVMILQSEADRFGYLLGSINALLYSIVYAGLGLYATAASAFFLSVPIQFMTFVNWKRHAFGKTVVFKKMTFCARILVGLGTAAVCAIVIFVLNLSGSDYALFDTLASVLGILVSLLTMLGYIEYSYIWPVSSLTSLFLSAQVIMHEMSQMPYFVYALYSFYCVIAATLNVRKYYKLQNSQGDEMNME